jgi:hypothetical protein
MSSTTDQEIPVVQLNDRQLQEQQTILLRKIDKNVNRIYQNVQFWFYFSLIALAIGLFIAMG